MSTELSLLLLLKPLGLIVLLALFAVLFRWPVQRFMRDGRLKRLLLLNVSGDENARRWREFRARSKAAKKLRLR